MQNIPFHPLSEVLPLVLGNEFVELKKDILNNGLREPIVMYEGQILDGRNRFRACQESGVAPDFTEYKGNDPAAFVVSLNVHRRHLNESQRAMVAAKLANIENGGDRVTEQSANLHSGSTSRAEAAKMLNVSRRTVNNAKKVERAGAAELVDAVERGTVAVSTAADLAALEKKEQADIVAKGEKEILARAKEIRAEKAKAKKKDRMGRIAEISQGNEELNTDKKYPVIYCDPPWRYDYAETSNREIENHYPTMDNADICALPVSDLAFEDSVLFMWATSPKLIEALEVVKAWGFTYRTCAIWDKQKIGMGYYFRQQHELLLVATRGSIPAPDPSARTPSVFSYPRGEHSSKPQEVYEIIEAMYPGLLKIELFCRTPREGWTAWGNQSDAA